MTACQQSKRRASKQRRTHLLRYTLALLVSAMRRSFELKLSYGGVHDGVSGADPPLRPHRYSRGPTSSDSRTW